MVADRLNGADDVDGGARGPHFLKFETRLRHVAPRFAIVTWGRRCKVCPEISRWRACSNELHSFAADAWHEDFQV